MYAVVCKVSPRSRRSITVGKYRTKKAAKRVAAGARHIRNPYGACRVVKRTRSR